MKKGAERSRTSQCFGNFDGKHSKERHSSGKHRFSHPEKKSCETSAFFFFKWIHSKSVETGNYTMFLMAH